MAGYSGTPLYKKLAIKPGHRVLVVGGPEDYARWVDGHEAVLLVEDDGDPVDIVHLFSRSTEEVASRFAELACKIVPTGSVWVSWPKKASKVPTDLSDGVVRRIGLEAGLVDTKVCAVNQVWSGLRFMIRKRDR